MPLLRGTKYKYVVNEIKHLLYIFFIVKDIEIDAEDLENADKQCVVASINFETFPMTYTLIGSTCNETHQVICQNFYGMQILIIL